MSKSSSRSITENKIAGSKNIKIRKIDCKTCYFGLFIAGLFIIYLRSMYAVTTPCMYAEDGTWTGEIYQFGFWYTLFFAKSSYLVFGNVILLELSSLLNKLSFGNNLNNLPFFITIISYFFYSALALTPVICLKKHLHQFARLFIWFFVLLMPLGDDAPEIFGRISNIGYAFLFLSFCFLVWLYDNISNAKKYQIIIADFLIFLCPTTNPACYPLVLAAFFVTFFAQWKKTGEKDFLKNIKTIFSSFGMKMWIFLLLMLGLSLLFKMIYLKQPVNQPNEKIITSALPEFFARSFLYNFLFGVWRHLTDLISVILLILYFAFLIFNYFLLSNKQVKNFYFASILSLMYFVAASLISRPSLTKNLDNHYTSSYPDRYFYCATIFTLIIFACIISTSISERSNKTIRINASVIFAALCLLNIFCFKQIFEFNSPKMKIASKTFESRIEEAYEKDLKSGSGYSVPIDFDGWYFWISKEQMASSLSHVRKADPSQLNKLTTQYKIIFQITDFTEIKKKLSGYHTNISLKGKSLAITATGTDPQVLNFESLFGQLPQKESKIRIKINYNVDHFGNSQLFYTTPQNRFFIESNSIVTYSDSKPITYVISCMQSTKFRFDIPDNSTFIINSITVEDSKNSEN